MQISYAIFIFLCYSPVQRLPVLRAGVVDCRVAMPNVSDWNDEIHGISKGFEEVEKRFKAVLDGVLIEATS